MEQMNAGVFKIRSTAAEGKIKFSSLKQYGLAEGEYKEIKPQELASKIELADENEKINLLQKAFLNVSTFQNTFETFQGSIITESKIKAYAVSTLKIHPDLSEKFISAFIESAELAGLCSTKGDNISFISANGLTQKPIINDDTAGDDVNEDKDDELPVDEDSEGKSDEEIDDPKDNPPPRKRQSTLPNIDLKIDPTLDPDKLEKQLKILRKFGLI